MILAILYDLTLSQMACGADHPARITGVWNPKVEDLAKKRRGAGPNWPAPPFTLFRI